MMISLAVVFFIFVFFFALVGALRGWATEMLVTFSVILTLFLVIITQDYIEVLIVPFKTLDVNNGFVEQDVAEDIVILEPEEVQPFSSIDSANQVIYRRQFWYRTGMLILLVFFGYQTPKIARLGGSVRREKLQDTLLGFVVGAFNGYLIIGTIWSYMHSAHYPFEPYIIAPDASDPLLDMATTLINILPPVWLGTSPGIFIAVGLAFLFVLVVFI